MTINLSKGGNINLSKEAPHMSKATVGLGWSANTYSGDTYDLDASAVVCGADGKALNDESFVFYNNLQDPSGAVKHMGDNRTGDGDGDDEQINIDLAALPAEADKIVFIVSIDDAERKGQHFGDIPNSYCRLFDTDRPDGEDFRYDLREEASNRTAMVYAELYRYGSDWKFRAIGQGYDSGLAGVIRDYGLFAK